MVKINFKKGFTLIELLMVVAIISLLASVVFAAVGNAREKGRNAVITSNLVNAQRQAEIFYLSNTASSNSYTNVCGVVAGNGTDIVGGAKTVYSLVTAAAITTGFANLPPAPPYSYQAATQSIPGFVPACNDSAGAWAVEMPLYPKLTSGYANQLFWCIDSTGKSKQSTRSITGAGDFDCN